MTASFLLRNQGRERDIIKLPECLRHILGQSGYFTPEHGQRLREWVGGMDPVERAKNRVRLAATEGEIALKAAWEGIGKDLRGQLGKAFLDTLRDQAVAADNEKAAVRGDTGAPQNADGSSFTPPSGDDNNIPF